MKVWGMVKVIDPGAMFVYITWQTRILTTADCVSIQCRSERSHDALAYGQIAMSELFRP